MKYHAFISYSHRDKEWGIWLHKALEAYKVPKALVGQTTPRGDPVPARAFPVFRDQDELPTSTSLRGAIQEALEQSRTLIVICSPRSAKSLWVNQEILNYKRLGREDRIFAIIVDGTPNGTDRSDPDNECFPPALRFQLGPEGNLSSERTEPIAADARPHADGKSNALLKLLAGVLGVNYDDLKRRDEIARRRRQRILVAVSATVTLTFAALALVALRQRNEAIAQRERAQQQEARAVTGEASAVKERERAEAQLYNTSIALADSSLRESRVDLAKAALWRLPSKHRGWEWGALLRQAYASDWSLTVARPNQLDEASVAPDGLAWVAWSRTGLELTIGRWSAEHGYTLRQITVDAPVKTAHVSQEGGNAVVLTERSLVLHTPTGQNTTIPAEGGRPWEQAHFFDRNGTQVMAFSAKHWFIVNSASGAVLHRGEAPFLPTKIHFSEHGDRLSLITQMEGSWTGPTPVTKLFDKQPEDDAEVVDTSPSELTSEPGLWLDNIIFGPALGEELSLLRSGGCTLSWKDGDKLIFRRLTPNEAVSYRHTAATAGAFSEDGRQVWFTTLGQLYHFNRDSDILRTVPLPDSDAPTAIQVIGNTAAIGTRRGRILFQDAEGRIPHQLDARSRRCSNCFGALWPG